MNGQFKRPSFNRQELKEFGAEVIQNGVPATIRWTRGLKETDEDVDIEKACIFSLSKDEKIFFRQSKLSGSINFANLDDTESETVLTLMKKHHFYTRPNWDMNIFLVVVYAIVIGLIAYARDEAWLQILLVSGCFFVLLFLIVAYLYAMGKVNSLTYIICGVFGAIGYICTAIWSLLALPLFRSIFQHVLYKKIKELPAVVEEYPASL